MKRQARREANRERHKLFERGKCLNLASRITYLSPLAQASRGLPMNAIDRQIKLNSRLVAAADASHALRVKRVEELGGFLEGSAEEAEHA